MFKRQINLKNNYFNPLRVWKIFLLLLTFFLLIKRKDRFLFFKPLKPKELKEYIVVLGASFIKLAQVLATRADFFSPEYLNELKTLHDELPPMKEKEFDTVYKSAFDNKDVFKSFDKTPIASASIGQVHTAYLHDGKKVAVKLRRYGIKKRVLSDIKILKVINTLFRPMFSHYTKNSIEAVIEEFSKMILEEVSFVHELNNLKKFSKVYHDSQVRFPKAFDEYCTDEALVMTFMDGFRFDNKEEILKREIDFSKVIAKLVDFYAEQMLVKGYFHADPHPGNLLIDENGELILLDFGMVKSIPNETRIAIINMIKSAHEKDYETYVSSSKKLGTIAYEAPKAEVAEFVERMFEIFADNSLSALSMQNLAFEILESTRNLPFKLPQEAIYILRVSAIIEGLGTTYISNFNGIKDILPVLQKNIPRALGSKDSMIEIVLDDIKDIPFLIKDFKNTIKQANEGELKVELSPYQLEWLSKEAKEYLKPVVVAFAFMLFSIFLVLVFPETKLFATILFVFSIIRILYR